MNHPETGLPAPDLEHVLEHAGAAWESLRGGRVFITGGTGVFGRWLLASLATADRALDLGARALVLTRDPAAFLARHPGLAGSRALEFLAGDVRSFRFPEGPFTHLVHAATTSSASPERIKPREMFETIFEGTRRTLEFARRSGVRRALFISSGAVYGRQPPVPDLIEEDAPFGPDPLNPGSAYDEGKRAAELLCALAHAEDGIEVTVARCFAVVGPLLPIDAHFAVGNFLRDGLAGGPVRVNGDGTPYRSYLHMADLSAWLWTILASGAAGRAYNVGSDRPVTIGELASKVAALFGVEVTTARPAIAGRPPSRYLPSIERARRELGLDVRIGLDDALIRTLDWLRRGPTVAPHSP